jgi:hypothetical protein
MSQNIVTPVRSAVLGRTPPNVTQLKAASAKPSRSKWMWLVVAAVVGLAIAALPTPRGLSRPGQFVRV